MAPATTTSDLPHPQPQPSSERPSGEGGLRLGRMSGVELAAHWSLVVVFVLVLLSLGGGTIRAWHPDWSPALVWSVALAAAVLFFVSIALHELAHAWVGKKVGMPVDRVTLFVFGGMAHTRHFPPSPKAELLMALAGPITSAIIGLVSGLVASLLLQRVGVGPADDPETIVAAAGPVTTLLLWLGPVNLMLAIFNILPGFPLDGGRVLRAILWATSKDIKKATRWAAAAGSALGWFLVALGVLMLFGLYVVPIGGGPVSGMWFMLIGWFLHIAARSGYQTVLLRESLSDVPASDVMRADVVTIDPGLRVDQLVADYLMRLDQRAFPVVASGVLVGLVAFEDVRKAPRDQFSTMSVADIMTRADQLELVSPEDSAFEALVRMSKRGVNQLPVVEPSGTLRGVVTRADLLKWMWMTSEP